MMLHNMYFVHAEYFPVKKKKKIEKKLNNKQRVILTNEAVRSKCFLHWVLH